MKVYKLRVQVGDYISTRLGTCVRNTWRGADGMCIPSRDIIERHPASARETQDFIETWNEVNN